MATKSTGKNSEPKFNLKVHRGGSTVIEKTYGFDGPVQTSGRKSAANAPTRPKVIAKPKKK